MKFKPIIFVLFATIASNVFAESTYSPLCPSDISVSEEVINTPAGWTTFTLPFQKHFLSGIKLYSGHPKEGANLRPEEKNAQLHWQLSPSESIYIACEYNKTSQMLIQPLPANTIHCELTLDKNTLGENGYLPKKIKCNTT